jgi:hypothetical protein
VRGMQPRALLTPGKHSTIWLPQYIDLIQFSLLSCFSFAFLTFFLNYWVKWLTETDSKSTG